MTPNYNDITQEINKNLKLNNIVDFIIKIMKKYLKFNFKKVKPWLNWINLNRICKIKKLFVVKFNKNLNDRTLIINIDVHQ